MDNSTPHLQELLVRYLDGELSGTEKSYLEHKLASDSVLQEQLDELKLAREAVRIYGLREKVAGIHDQMMKQPLSPVKQVSQARRVVRYAISVAAAILVVVMGITIWNFYQLSPNKVLAAHYVSYELATTRDALTDQSKIETAYRSKDFDEVLRLAPEAVVAKENMLVAMANFEKQRYPEAITLFKKVIEQTHPSRDKMLHEAAQYYISLAFIGNKDYDYALERLNMIYHDPSHLYHEKVNGRLLRQVKMLKWR